MSGGGYWGTQVYSTGDRVPVRALRCTSTSNGSTKHPCRQHETHVGPHRCICGKSWERTEAVSA